MSVTDLDTLDAVMGLIESTLKIPADDVDIDSDFETFGINSLIAMELMENIETQFDIELTPAQFSEVNTINQLSDLVDTLLAQTDTSAASEAAQAVATEGTEAFRVSGEGGAQSVEQAVAFVRQKHGIDLSAQSFASVDAVIEAAAGGHASQLMHNYGLSGQGSFADSLNLNMAVKTTADIAIVGISCRFPDADDHHAFWNNLLEGKNSMREIPASRWDWREHFSEEASPLKTLSKWGALIDAVDCFDAEFFAIGTAEANTMDPQQRLLLEQTYQAFEDAGENVAALAGSNTGVFVGYEYSEYEQYLRCNLDQIKDAPIFSSSSPTYYLSNRLSFVFDLCGPSESINMNCASSALAINSAYYSLLNRQSDMALCAGVSLNLFVDDYIASSQYGILSPTGTSAVFDDNADGFTRGEGVAAVVLKRLEDAERDNNNIYAVIKCSHQNNRGFARDISEIKFEAITKVLSDCYDKVGMGPEAIDYIEVDGYATKWADSFEFEGIKHVFENNGENPKHCALGSLKGNIGNVESVNGLAAVIKLAMSMKHQQFPATITKQTLNTFIDIDNPSHPCYIAESNINFADIRRDENTPVRAGVNSFADSGVNVHILIEEYQPKQTKDDAGAAGQQLYLLSAKNSARLEHRVADLLAVIATADEPSFMTNLAYTLQCGREPMDNRLAIVAGSPQELSDKLAIVKKSGLQGKLRYEKKGIFHANVSQDNLAATLVTQELAGSQLTQSIQSGQWQQMALLWVNGVVVDWNNAWRHKSVQRLSLPTYPFAKNRYWVEFIGQEQKAKVGSGVASDTDTSRKVADVVESAPQAADYYFYLSDGKTTVESLPMGDVERVEMFFKHQTARLLNIPIDEVAPDLDFLELGFDSIGVAEMINNADKLFGINLSPSVLYKYPEIGSFSEYVVETYAQQVERLIVTQQRVAELEGQVHDNITAVAKTREQIVDQIIIPMQAKGRKRAIFAIPGADGSILSFQQLSQACGETQPFYGIESVGLDTVTPVLKSVQEMAVINIEAMKTIQAKGPYRILGYSNGGIVAYEMVRQLLEHGDKVAALYMLDSVSPLVQGPNELSETIDVFKQLVHTLGGQLELSLEQLEAVEVSQRGEFLYDILLANGMALPKAQFLATYRVSQASEQACRSYKPGKLDKALDVTLFNAVDGYTNLPLDYGWDQLLVKPMSIEKINATHFTLIDAKPVKDIAKTVNRAAKKANKKNRQE